MSLKCLGQCERGYYAERSVKLRTWAAQKAAQKWHKKFTGRSHRSYAVLSGLLLFRRQVFEVHLRDFDAAVPKPLLQRIDRTA